MEGSHIRYVGGKVRIQRHILPIMLEGVDPSIPWIEPFVGAGSVISNVPASHPRIGADTNPFLIELLRAVRDGWVPPTHVTEAEWRDIRAHQDAYPAPLVAFVGFACSFAGRWFEGFARDRKGKTNFALNGSKSLTRMAPKLVGVDFQVSDYLKLELPPAPALLFLDPPYTNSTKNYYRFGGFDGMEFWAWAEHRAREGYTVFVSEFSGPPSAKLVWSRERGVSLTPEKGLRKIDCLFKVEV